MKKTVLTCISILCLLVPILSVGLRMSAKASPSLPVHNIDKGLDYSTIQEAIDAANETNTIYVEVGTYNGDITVNKAGLKIFGENRRSVIHGRVTIEADGVLFNGFMIRENLDIAILLENVDSCTISSNDVSNVNFGIVIHQEPGMLEQEYGGNNICGNMLENNTVGILSQSQMGIPPGTVYGDNFLGNILVNNSYGILISSDIGIPNPKIYGGNAIRGNKLMNNLHGLYFNYSLGTLSLSDGDSIAFGQNILQGNNLTDNGYAIEVYCEEIGILNMYGEISLIFGNNRIFGNCFSNNTNLRSASIKYIGILDVDVWPDGKSIVTALEHWDDGYPSGGISGVIT